MNEIKNVAQESELSFNNWDEIIKTAPKDSTVVAWLDNELQIDSLEKFKQFFPGLDLMLIQRLRIFNKDAEMHIIRSNGVLKGRLRDDTGTSENGCEPLEFHEALQLLWGTSAKKEEAGYISLSEERGTNLKIPKFFDGAVNKDKRIFIKTRNYIDFTPAHHATYVDHRFVEFVVET